MKISDAGPNLKGIISQETAELFEQRWANLLVCFSVTDIFSSIADYFRIEGLPQYALDDFSCATLAKATESAFLELLRRGALDEFIKISPLPSAAQAELDEMSGVVSTDPAIEARQKHADAIAECARDFKSLSTQDFRLKWMGVHRSVYEAAIQKRAI